MDIAITGGTGSFGGAAAAALARRGHAVRLLARRPPATAPAGATHHAVDLTDPDPAALRAALGGADAVVDAANARSPAQARRVLVEGSRRLAAAAAEAGVRHHVLASIVGIEHLPFGYYRAKVAQERALDGAALPVTVVRTTQFHELVAELLAFTARRRLLPGGRLPLQPLAAREAGEVVADVVEAGPGDGRVVAAGPEVATLGELADRWRRARAVRALVVPVPLPARAGRTLRRGGLLAPEADRRGTLTFEGWLEAA